MKKDLGLATATSLVVGCVIGAGVFFKPYAIYQATGGAPGMGMLAWIAGGLLSLFGALTFAEVAVMIPKTGGMVTYLTEAFDERVGFLAGWMQVVIFYPAFLAGYGVKVGDELSSFVGERFELPIALLVIFALVAIHCRGAKAAGGMQVVSTVCKLVPLVLLMLFGFLRGSGHALVKPMVGEGVSVGGALGSTLLAVLFAFEGWTNVGAIAGEMRDPARDLPRAIVGGVSIIMAVYLAINVAYLWVIPAEELMALESPAAAVAERLFGSVGGTIIKCGIIVSVIGAGNGFLMSGSRVAFEPAEAVRQLPFLKPSGCVVVSTRPVVPVSAMTGMSGYASRMNARSFSRSSSLSKSILFSTIRSASASCASSKNRISSVKLMFACSGKIMRKRSGSAMTRNGSRS